MYLAWVSVAPLTTCTLTPPVLLAAIQTRTLPGNFEVGKRPPLVSACSLVGAHTRSFLLLKIPFTVKIFSSLDLPLIPQLPGPSLNCS